MPVRLVCEAHRLTCQMSNRRAQAALGLTLSAAVLWMASGTALCVGVAAADPAQRGSPPTAVTFGKDVAPILLQQCAGCHRPDGSAPFSLLTFGDARPRARAIATAVRRRTMPRTIKAATVDQLN